MSSLAPAPLSQRRLNRRSFIQTSFWLLAGISPAARAVAGITTVPTERKLRLFNPTTEELLETVYWKDGALIPDALADIDLLMRDTRSGEHTTMDRGLIDLLYRIQLRLDLQAPLHVISAFRTRSSNDRLRKQGWAASKNSYHIHGKAVDIRHPEATTATLRRAAYALKHGGVGYYPRLNFVHLDSGPVRFWRKE